MLTRTMKQQVRQLLAEHIGNPKRHAARDARRLYIGEVFAASMHGEDTDRDAEDWLRRLTELCGAHVGVDPTVDHWFAIEEARLLKLANRSFLSRALENDLMTRQVKLCAACQAALDACRCFTVGDRVRFREALDPGDEHCLFNVVEDNGDRVRIRLVCELPIRPEKVVRRADVCKA